MYTIANVDDHGISPVYNEPENSKPEGPNQAKTLHWLNDILERIQEK